MDWARAKTILIFILVGVNAVLAGILAFRHWEAARGKADTLAAAVAVLESAGYQLDKSLLPESSAPVLDIARDADTEKAAAEYLLKSPAQAMPLSEGGASIRYMCPLGECVFRTGGSFELTPYEPLDAEDAAGTLTGWLRGMGFWSGELPPDILLTSSGCVVSAVRGGFASWDENAVFAFSGARVVSVSGRWQLGRESRSSLGTSNSAQWSLLSLADYLRASGALPGRLISMELGYRSEVLSPGLTRFTPHWRVELEAGSYYVNALTGAAEPI